MGKAKMFFCIVERDNYQHGVYYVPKGSLSGKDIKRHENPIYGHNIVHKYETEEQYNEAINVLNKQGKKIIQ